MTCKKIASTSNRFGSFQVVAECKEVAELYDTQLWPAGIYVRRYYEARKSRERGSLAQMAGEAEYSSVPGATSGPAAIEAIREESAHDLIQ